jgi:hypothetical protein
MSDRSLSVPLNRANYSFLSVLLGVTAIAVVALYSGAGHSRAKPQPAANATLPQVQVAEVIRRPLREWQEFSGRRGGEAHQTLLIEDRAVGIDLSKTFVLTRTKNNRIEYRLVELGPEINGLSVVTQVLAPRELIVVGGFQRVRPGQSVVATRVAMSTASGLAQVAALSIDESEGPAAAASPSDAVSRLAQAAAALHVVR